MRLENFGANVLHARRVTVFGILLRQLRNPLLILLLAAAGISALTGDLTDGAIITAIVVLSVGLGFVNEYRSARRSRPCTGTSTTTRSWGVTGLSGRWT